jgi:hypothetical protein
VTIDEDLRAFRSERWTIVLKTCQDEYKDLLDAWGKLDGKAQGSATISGVFLAAVFAAARGNAIPASAYARGLIAFAIILLVAAVVCAGTALRVQAAASGPSGEQMETVTLDLDDICDANCDVEAMRIRFLRSQINSWRKSTASFREANRRKSDWVRRAQRLLFAGIGCALVVTLYLLAKGPTT